MFFVDIEHASWLQENRWICENDSPHHVFFGKIILPTNIPSTALEQVFKLGFGTRNFVSESLPFHATVVSFVRGFGGGGSPGINLRELMEIGFHVAFQFYYTTHKE